LPPQWGAPFLSYEVFLEPIGTEVIFGLPRVVTIQGRFSALTADAGEGLNLAAPPSSRLRYLAVSQPPRIRGPELTRSARAGDYPREIRETYLQLPEISPRLRALARELGAGAQSPYEVARRVETYLSQTLAYSLDLRPDSDLDPLDDFLFERKAGNCEFFAASMAILLRAQGIPARVVNGFQRGEWNDLGQYFAVRQRDAHAWVEVFSPGVGWLTFDPSPRASFDQRTFAESGWAGKYFDALRMRWNRYVIDYNVGDQAQLVVNLRRQSLAFRQSVGQAWDVWSFQVWRSLRRLWRQYRLFAGVLLAVLAASLVLFRRAPRGSLGLHRVRARSRTVVFYERMIRLLARRGFARSPAATAREFAAALVGRPELHAPVQELTGLYERVRFGGEPLTTAEEARIAGLLRDLAMAPR
jgi:hypothetical protein